jgi:hypothetical protein
MKPARFMFWANFPGASNRRLGGLPGFRSAAFMLSSEATAGEITWSRAEYMTGRKIWQAFKLPGSPPPAYGIFANQPSPYAASVGISWRTWLWLNVALAGAGFSLHVYFSGPRRVQRSLCLLAGSLTEALKRQRVRNSGLSTGRPRFERRALDSHRSRQQLGSISISR